MNKAIQKYTDGIVCVVMLSLFIGIILLVVQAYHVSSMGHQQRQAYYAERGIQIPNLPDQRI